ASRRAIRPDISGRATSLIRRSFSKPLWSRFSSVDGGISPPFKAFSSLFRTTVPRSLVRFAHFFLQWVCQGVIGLNHSLQSGLSQRIFLYSPNGIGLLS